jgi:hypothetical protein
MCYINIGAGQPHPELSEAIHKSLKIYVQQNNADTNYLFLKHIFTLFTLKTKSHRKSIFGIK